MRLQATIRDTLRDDVERLGRVLGRDLGHWLRPKPPLLPLGSRPTLEPGSREAAYAGGSIHAQGR
jgi:hypothetical protein